MSEPHRKQVFRRKCHHKHSMVCPMDDPLVMVQVRNIIAERNELRDDLLEATNTIENLRSNVVEYSGQRNEARKRALKLASELAIAKKEQCPHDYGLLKDIEQVQFPNVISQLAAATKKADELQGVANEFAQVILDLSEDGFFTGGIVDLAKKTLGANNGL